MDVMREEVVGPDPAGDEVAERGGDYGWPRTPHTVCRPHVWDRRSVRGRAVARRLESARGQTSTTVGFGTQNIFTSPSPTRAGRSRHGSRWAALRRRKVLRRRQRSRNAVRPNWSCVVPYSAQKGHLAARIPCAADRACMRAARPRRCIVSPRIPSPAMAAAAGAGSPRPRRTSRADPLGGFETARSRSRPAGWIRAHNMPARYSASRDEIARRPSCLCRAMIRLSCRTSPRR